MAAGEGIEQCGGLSGVQRGEMIEKLHGVRARDPSDSREAGLGLRFEIGEQQCGDVCSKVSHSGSKQRKMIIENARRKARAPRLWDQVGAIFELTHDSS